MTLRLRLCAVLVCAIAPSACAWFAPRPVDPHAAFIVEGHDAKTLPIAGRQADELVTGCAESHNCDRAHFIRALVALYEDRSVALRHFQEVISAAPSSERASSSLFWLRLLREAHAESVPDSQLARATDRLVHDLLDRELLVLQLSKEIEMSPVRSLQRELKTRDKKVEELTGQIEALKKIDREIREKTLPKKPPHTKPAP